MKKKILAITMLFIIALSTLVSAYSWKKDGSTFYIYDDATGELVKNSLIDVGDNVYYFDNEGKMVTGWWENQKTGKVYFFNNNITTNYGGMVFGLHMIDGYYRYFNNDGSVAASDKEGEYKKVYLEFYADYIGNLYFNNTLLRDVTTNKSEYYSNAAYYTDATKNNKTLAAENQLKLVGFMLGEIKIDGSSEKFSQSNIASANQEAVAENKLKEKQASGGTNYHIDANGRVVDDSAVMETTPFEQYGPMQQGSPSAADN